MRLRIDINKDGTKNFYVMESYRTEAKKSTTRIVKKLGTYDQLINEHEDPEAWARGVVAEMNRQAQEGKQKVMVPYTAMLSMLRLSAFHREHLRSKRGLTDEQIDAFGFKSTPPSYQCRAIAEQLIKHGYTIEGVPGFYMDDKDCWTVRFFTKTAGIIIPMRDVSGKICGLQTRLDHPIKDKDAPPDKEGTKYLSLSSAGKKCGASCGALIHFVGDPNARVVYVTEGGLKADIAHALTNRTFLATVGVNSLGPLDEIFAFLKKNGTEEIIEAEDMDKFRKPSVNKGAAQV